MRSSLIRLGLLCAATVFLATSSGCKEETVSCDKLVELACQQVEKRRDGVERCDRLKKQAKAVDEKDCASVLRMLKDEGKLKTTGKR